MSAKRKISFKQLKIYLKLQDEGLQHLLYGSGIFVLIFIAFNIELYDNGQFGKFTLFETFVAALKYFFLAGIPVYFSFFLFHRRKLHKSALDLLFRKEIADGSVYPAFIIFVAVASVIFTFPLHYLYRDLGLLKILTPHWYGTFLGLFLMVILISGADDYRNSLKERPRPPKVKAKQESLILLDDNGNRINVNICDIRYVKGDKNYQAFYLNAKPYGKKELFDRETLKHYHRLLPKNEFFQCHRSNIVNKKFVIGFAPGWTDFIMRNPNGDKEEKVSIGDKFRGDAKVFFGDIFPDV